MTIERTLLARGYFPKELPPAFFTNQFAAYAGTRAGRKILSAYKPRDNFTEPVDYRLALPGGEQRLLRIPHPFSFRHLVCIVTKNFSRLLARAGDSHLSKSRPVYASNRHRAISTVVNPANLSREKACARAGSAFLLKTDVSQFYPALYTHAVGWAIDPKLRKRANWKNGALLGKNIDQALMDLQGKVSHGIPIGNDLSFLLAELVLAQVDKAARLPMGHAYRWYDDYEIACDTRKEAEQVLARLSKELERFRLRLNPYKTRIVALPQPAQEEWQHILLTRGKAPLVSARDMVEFFDEAFRMRERFPDAPVLMYALGILFRLRLPSEDAGQVAQSGITQSLLCEPGAAQKAFALLTFWHLNGFSLDNKLLSNTASQIVVRHAAIGMSSDVAWALAFCLSLKIPLKPIAGKLLSKLEDDCITIQALHLYNKNLLPGFEPKSVAKALKRTDLDGEHWLATYESLRQGFLDDSAHAVAANALFADLLAKKITFYRQSLPVYATVVHPGGAPEWAARLWLKNARQARTSKQKSKLTLPILKLMTTDVTRLSRRQKIGDPTINDLLDIFTPREFSAIVASPTPYS